MQIGLIPISDVIPLYNFVIILGILLSTLLLYLILKHFLNNPILIAIASLTLPWINPQLIRLSNGHFNLSQSWFILLVIYLLIQYSREGVSRKVKTIIEFSLIGTLLLATGYHVYYLPILGFFILSFLLSHSIIRRKLNWRPVIAAFGIPVAAVFLFLILNMSLDPGFFGRQESQLGFDVPQWRLNFTSLFTAYPHFGIRFILNAINPHHYESNSYLGGFFLFGMLILLVVRKWKNIDLKIDNPVITALGIAGLVCLITSLGTRVQIPGLGVQFDNLANPFLWIKKWSSSVEPFRSMGRFNWPFFWVANLALLYIVDRMVANKERIKYLSIIGYGLLIFLLLDAKDAVRFHNQEVYPNVVTMSDQNQIDALTQSLDPRSFEAIVPIPFFHVGSGNDRLTAHAESLFSRRACQLSVKTGLPMMSSLMSRTSPEIAERQFNIFLDPVNSALQDLVGTKPLLILGNENQLIKDLESARRDNHPETIDFLERQLTFLRHHPLLLLGRVDEFSIYQWDYHQEGSTD